jgi:hypothetical protein
MYQTKLGMSTGGNANTRSETRQTERWGSDLPVFDGLATDQAGVERVQVDLSAGWTWVTCPILRPGRGAPLP